MDKQSVGMTLKSARIKAGLTQQEVGIACGCSEKYSQRLVSFWENDYRPIPRDKISAISKLLNIPIENLL